MYERYIEEARRAIFYARAVTMFTGATAIDSIHMLSGVMWQADFRAQILFGLHEIFPLYSGRPYLFVESEILKKVDGPQLTNDSKEFLHAQPWKPWLWAITGLARNIYCWGFWLNRIARRSDILQKQELR